MKKLLSVAAIAVLFAVGSAFTITGEEWWNVNNPRVGTPGIVWLTTQQVKQLYCPGLDNVECAYLISSPIQIVKKPY
jgi:hypothetical protein